MSGLPLHQENDYLQCVFHKKNYNSNFIKLNPYKDNECDKNNSLTTTATMPYIKDMSKIILCIL